MKSFIVPQTHIWGHPYLGPGLYYVSMIAWIGRHGRKIQEIGTGLFLYEALNLVFDLVFYPFAILWWGIVLGGVIATGLSLAINAGVFWLYEYMRIDWLGAHALRELDAKENKTHIERLATWIGKKKVTMWEKLVSPLVFVTLLVPIDPVIVAIHYQRQHFSRLGWRDWGLLIVATTVANFWWLIKVGLAIEIIRLFLSWLGFA